MYLTIYLVALYLLFCNYIDVMLIYQLKKLFTDQRRGIEMEIAFTGVVEQTDKGLSIVFDREVRSGTLSESHILISQQDPKHLSSYLLKKGVLNISPGDWVYGRLSWDDEDGYKPYMSYGPLTLIRS